MKVIWKDGTVTQANTKECRLMALHAWKLGLIEEVV
jgi:hypothetical protein